MSTLASYPREDLAPALHRCEGYAVDSPDGRLGVVEDVGWCHGRPEALAVRDRLSGKRVFIISAEEVEDVVPAERRVVLRGGPYVRASLPLASWRSRSGARARGFGRSSLHRRPGPDDRGGRGRGSGSTARGGRPRRLG